jgi:hypothetical protein
MKGLLWILAALCALAFIFSVIGSLTGFRFIGVHPEAYSRGCTNVALIGILVALLERWTPTEK